MEVTDFDHAQAIAVIGLAGRFPGARDVRQYWDNILAGRDSISHFSTADLLKEGVPAKLVGDPRYVPARGVLEDADTFDAAFFGYSAREAEMMDPQQRVFLETVHTCFEAAGYDSFRFDGRIGVFAGAAVPSYLINRLRERLDVGTGDPLEYLIGNDKDFLPTRVSYKLNLRGPSVSVQTACSTSLVAVHLAVQSLLAGECDMAIAGGVSVQIPQREGYLFVEGSILSPDGRCRPFDVQARGTVAGDGVGAVLLRRLDHALTAGDTIHAVIRGSAINNDGSSKVAFTAPSLDGQREVIVEAQAMAGISPRSIGFVEAHGTATALGDSIEVAALTRAFQARTDDKRFCALGSVKSNIGHLNTAAGVAGFIKATLAVREGLIPGTVHFRAPHPALGLSEGPFFVNGAGLRWPADRWPRRAGVSAFGLGGTNVHLVLEEAPRRTGPRQPGRRPQVGSTTIEEERPRLWQVFPVSAKSPSSLQARMQDLRSHLETSTASAENVAFTLQSRFQFQCRGVALASAADSQTEIATRFDGPLLEGLAPEKSRRLVLCFDGLLLDDFAAELTGDEPVLRGLLDGLEPVIRRSRQPGWVQGGGEATVRAFARTYAFAAACRELGLRPDAFIGWGLGEVVGLCLANLLPLEAGIRIAGVWGTDRSVVDRLQKAGLHPGNVEGPPGDARLLSSTTGEWLVRERLLSNSYWNDLQQQDGWPPGMTQRVRTLSDSAVLVIGNGELAQVANLGQSTEEPSTAIVAVTGASPAALAQNAARMADAPSAAWTTGGLGQQTGLERCVVVADGIEDARAALALVGKGESAPGVWRGRARESRSSDVAFMFTGHGAQYPGMGRSLYRNEAIFRDVIDLCSRHAGRRIGSPFAEIVLGESGSETLLDDWVYAQGAIFALEAALSRLWRAWGVQPSVVIGHSLGEYAAAETAGAFSLETGLDLVLERARLMREQSIPGDMAVVFAPEAVVAERIAAWPGVTVAAVNHPANTVISGARSAVRGAVESLARDGWEVEVLNIAHASHSPAMDGVLAPYLKFARAVSLRPLSLPLVSNMTGTLLQPGSLLDGQYWTDHLREPVRFWDGCQVLRDRDLAAVMELGPSSSLLGIARQCWSERPVAIVSALKRGRPELRHVAETAAALYVQGLSVRGPLEPRGTGSNVPMVASTRPAERAISPRSFAEAVGRLWALGIPVDWEAYNRGRPCSRVSLPTYPFERQQYFAESTARLVDGSPDQGSRAEALRKAPSPADWCYISSWKRGAPLPPGPLRGRWLVFSDGGPVADRVIAGLRDQGGEVLRVIRGDEFRASAETCTVSPRDYEHHQQLAQRVARAGGGWRLLHLWEVNQPSDSDRAGLDCFHSLVMLVRALDAAGLTSALRLDLVTADGQDVIGTEPLVPGRATIIAAARVVGQEYPGIDCRSIDVTSADSPAAAADALLRELTVEREPIVALRSGNRWLETFERLPEKTVIAGAPVVREGGLYVITGGLGGIGSVLAGWLARQARVRLVLLGRTQLPERARWAGFDGDPSVAQKLRRLQQLEECGATVLPVAVDVGDVRAMIALFARLRDEMGPVAGVIHAAGVGGGGMIQLKTAGDIETVWRPKVQGTLALANVLRGQPLDFFVVCSALNATTGAVGHVDYCAANAYVDLLARARQRQGQKLAAIAWDAWADVGMAVETPVPAGMRETWEAMRDLAIRPAEGEEVFQRLAARSLPHVMVSTCDLKARLESTKRLLASERDGDTPLESGVRQKHQRPLTLRTPFVAPRDELEREIASVWAELLGFEGLGVQDNFMELGGHSLLATRVVAQLRRRFGVNLPLSRFFECLTIEGLARAVGDERARAASLSSDSQDVQAENGKQEITRHLDPPELQPLSCGQERLWFLHQLQPDSPAYNMAVPLRLRGPLDLPRLKEAVRQAIDRHDILRVRLVLKDGMPFQRLGSDPECALRVVEVPASEADRDRAVREAVEREARAPFKMIGGPLIRMAIVKASDEDHVLVTTLHHLIGDGWSLGILLGEISQLYAAAMTGTAPALGELPIQFFDFAHWQRRQLRDGAFERQFAYWKERLAGAPATLPLPLDGSRSEAGAPRGRSVSRAIDKAAAEQLSLFCQREGVTPFMVVLSALNTLLHRCSGVEDVVLGSPVANRNRRELQNVIGPIANTVVLRTRIESGDTARDVLARVRACSLGALANDELPFEPLIEALRQAGAGTFSLPVLFIYGAPVSPPSFAGLTVEPMAVEAASAMADLVFYAWSDAQAVTLGLEYNSSLFKASTAERMLGQLEVMLGAIVSQTDRPVSELPLVGEEDRQRLLSFGRARRKVS